MFKLKIKPMKQNKKMMKFFERTDHTLFFEQLIEEGLEEAKKHLVQQGRQSIIDYSKLELVKIKEGYALVFPEERRALSYQDKHTILVEFPDQHPMGRLGLIPPEVLSQELRKEKLISRRVRKEEYQKVVEDWINHPGALIEQGLLSKGMSISAMRSRLTGLAPEAYAEIQAVENLAWTLLREEYGIGEKKVSIWNKEIAGLQEYVEDHMEEMLTRMQKGKQAAESSVSMEDIEQAEIDYFSKGLAGAIKPGKKPPA